MVINRRILLIIFSLSAALNGQLCAQPYEHAGGIRAGLSSGISYKGFFRYQMNAIEADVLYNRNGFNLTALYEHHLETFRNKRLLVYLGGGAFGGTWKEELSLGVTAVAGIEYQLRDVPLSLGADWKPMVNVYRVFDNEWADFGIAIRYRFR